MVDAARVDIGATLVRRLGHLAGPTWTSDFTFKTTVNFESSHVLNCILSIKSPIKPKRHQTERGLRRSWGRSRKNWRARARPCASEAKCLLKTGSGGGAILHAAHTRCIPPHARRTICTVSRPSHGRRRRRRVTGAGASTGLRRAPERRRRGGPSGATVKISPSSRLPFSTTAAPRRRCPRPIRCGCSASTATA